MNPGTGCEASDSTARSMRLDHLLLQDHYVVGYHPESLTAPLGRTVDNVASKIDRRLASGIIGRKSGSGRDARLLLQ